MLKDTVATFGNINTNVEMLVEVLGAIRQKMDNQDIDVRINYSPIDDFIPQEESQDI